MNDPRLAIAGVYRHLRGHADLIAAFEADLAACEGPEDALNLCDRWLDITIEEPRSGYYEPTVGRRV